MVVRTRIRAVVIPLVLYAVCGSAAAYFVWHAQNGPRGLTAKVEFKRQTVELRRELDQVKAERETWRHRVSLLQTNAIERDLLEEQARDLLNRVDRRDLVIFLDRK